jgi:hypothetical protein
MGYKIDNYIFSIADIDDHPPATIHVTGNSIADRISIEQGFNNIIELDLYQIKDLVNLLKNKGIIK